MYTLPKQTMLKSWILSAVHALLAGCAVLSSGEFERHGCPDGWVIFQESCYLFDADQTFDWTEAGHYCSNHFSSHLLVLDSQNEHNFVKDFLGKYSKAGNNGYYWIGATDDEVEGVWTWYTDHRRVNAGYQEWWPGEPDNVNNQDCGAVLDSAHHFLMGDTYCTTHERAICELNMTDIGMQELVGRR